MVGPDSTGPVALPFPPPCGKRGLAAGRILVCGNIMSPFHKRQPSFSLCRHLLVPQGGLSSVHYCTLLLILPPPFPSTTKKGKTEQIKVLSRTNSGRAGTVPTACSSRQQPPLPTTAWQKRPRWPCLQLVLLLVCQMDLIFFNHLFEVKTLMSQGGQQSKVVRDPVTTPAVHPAPLPIATV